MGLKNQYFIFSTDREFQQAGFLLLWEGPAGEEWFF
jgi:hypothetical protein